MSFWWSLFQAVPEAATEQAAQAAATGGPNVTRLVREEVPGGPLLIAAYMVLWVMVLGYLVWVRRSQVRLQQELEAVERKLDERVGGLAAAEPARR